MPAMQLWGPKFWSSKSMKKPNTAAHIRDSCTGRSADPWSSLTSQGTYGGEPQVIEKDTWCHATKIINSVCKFPVGNDCLRWGRSHHATGMGRAFYEFLCFLWTQSSQICNSQVSVFFWFFFWLLCLTAQLCWSVWVCVLQVCHIQTKDSLTNFSEMCLLKSDIPLQSTDSQQKPCSLRLREWEWGEQELSVIKNRSQGWEMKTVLPEASLEWESLFCLELSFTSQLPIGNGYCRYRKATPRS